MRRSPAEAANANTELRSLIRSIDGLLRSRGLAALRDMRKSMKADDSALVGALKEAISNLRCSQRGKRPDPVPAVCETLGNVYTRTSDETIRRKAERLLRDYTALLQFVESVVSDLSAVCEAALESSRRGPADTRRDGREKAKS